MFWALDLDDPIKLSPYYALTALLLSPQFRLQRLNFPHLHALCGISGEERIVWSCTAGLENDETV
jgi:hypothetical protein